MMEMPFATSGNFARRKLGFLKSTQVCRNCRQTLEEGTANTFTFEKKAFKKGTIIHMTVSAPSLMCGRCNVHFLPSPDGSHDDYYLELANVIDKVITKDFILQ